MDAIHKNVAAAIVGGPACFPWNWVGTGALGTLALTSLTAPGLGGGDGGWQA